MEELGEYLVDEVERLSEDEHIIGLYDGEKHARMVQNSIINYEVKKGIEKGLQQGIEQKQKDVVINMLKENMDLTLISKIVNIPVEQVEEIKNNYNL